MLSMLLTAVVVEAAAAVVSEVDEEVGVVSEVGMEVEYTIFNREKGGKVSAEGVKVLAKGSIPPLKAKEEVLNGKVVRPLRSVNPDQEDYCGLIQVSEEGTSKRTSLVQR